MKQPFKSLGFYKPKKYRASQIGTDLVDMFSLIVKPLHDDNGPWPQETSLWYSKLHHAEVRRFAQPAGQGREWHRDGDLLDGSRMDHASILWSAVTPTEFRCEGDDEIWRPEPFEIIIASNMACLHRTPTDAPLPPIRRWFFRQRVEVPDWL